MPNVFTLIGNSWELYKSQPVLNAVLVWLMVIPMSIMNILLTLDEQYDYFEQLIIDGSYGALFVIICILIACWILTVWGSACTLIIGKKLISSRAGRSKTSFASLRAKGRQYIIPIFFTSILQQCFVFFWALLLIIPGIIYAIRTFFYQVIVVTDGKMYREALKKSKNVVKGHTWTALFYLIGIGCVIFLPIFLIDDLLYSGMTAIDDRLRTAQVVLSAAIFAFASIITNLTIVGLYAAIKKLPKRA